MPDPTPTEEPKNQDPNPTPPPPAPPKADDKPPAAGDDKKLTEEDAARIIKETRGEAAEHRKKAAELQKQIDSYKEKESQAETDRLKEQGKFKEAAEKAQKDLDEYKKTAEVHRMRAEAKIAAIAAGMNPNAAKFLDTSDVKFDESGELVGIKEAIEKMKGELPEVFKTESDKSKDVKNTGSEKGDPPPGAKAGKPTVLATNAEGGYVMSDAEYEKAKKDRLKTL